MRAIFATILVTLLLPQFVHAKVTGPCANCHTMHNSQNSSQIYTETPMRGGPGYNLLRTTCISCHSSTDSSPTKTLGGCTVPIVYNTVEPAKITAGGNFYYVQNLGDEYGHNVITVDGTLSHAPGAYETNTTCGFEGCHKSLARIRLGPGPCAGTNCVIGNGCIGCHVPKHHAPDPTPPSVIVTEENGCYRFLGRPSWVWDIPPHSSRPCVEGIEDPDRELTVSPTDHNEYRDTDKPGAPYSPGSGNPQGISDFCAGCHRDYHSWDNQNRNRSNGNWLRHPAGDTEIPNRGEYAAYTTYNPQAPVSRPNLTTVFNTVTPGVDRVMCLSCHRAHGSPYPDILRWNYDDMIAGDNTKSGGCFTCHTQKNQAP